MTDKPMDVVSVPREPTEAMLKAIAHADWLGKDDLNWADGWRIMIAAAPPAHRAEDGDPTTVRGALEVAQRVLKQIARPQVNDGAVVIYSVSDDVPEDIAVALSYVEAALAAHRAEVGPADPWQDIATHDGSRDPVLVDDSHGQIIVAWRNRPSSRTDVWFTIPGRWAVTPTRFAKLPAPPTPRAMTEGET